MNRRKHNENWLLWEEGVAFVCWEKDPGEEPYGYAPEPELSDSIEFECRACGYHWKGAYTSRRCPKWLRELVEKTWREAKDGWPHYRSLWDKRSWETIIETPDAAEAWVKEQPSSTPTRKGRPRRSALFSCPEFNYSFVSLFCRPALILCFCSSVSGLPFREDTLRKDTWLGSSSKVMAYTPSESR